MASTSSINVPSEELKRAEQAMAIIEMDKDLFEAAKTGDIEPFNKYQGDFQCLVDGMKNTALHIHFRYIIRLTGHKIDFIKKLVEKCPLLLLQPNEKDEIPLHILAAKHGILDVVEFIIERTKILQNEDVEKGLEPTNRMKQMLRMRDQEGNTALHKAAESVYPDVMRLLVKELDPDDSTFSEENKRGETPLYRAIRCGCKDSVAEILGKCKSTIPGGPNGTTALHAASRSEIPSMVKILMQAKKHLIRETDDQGRTPLHYAAHFGRRSAVKQLLEADANAAYIRDKERGMTALHMAAWQGHLGIMEDIILYCPGCCELVDTRLDWNFLHFAAVTLDDKNFNTLIFDPKKGIQPPLNFHLLFGKDIKGITPSNVASLFAWNSRRHGHLTVLNSFRGYNVDSLSYWSVSDRRSKIKEQLHNTLTEIGEKAEVAGLGVHKFFLEGVKENRLDMKEIVDQMREGHLLVATLVATVTFAAGIAVPGGFKSESTGTATLSHNSAFIAFIITDALAFLSSLFAIFIHFLSVFFDITNVQSLFRWLLLADYFTVFAMAAMMVAFSTGTYAVLESSVGVAIATCSIGLTFFPISIIVPLLFIYFQRRRGFQN